VLLRLQQRLSLWISLAALVQPKDTDLRLDSADRLDWMVQRALENKRKLNGSAFL